MVELEQNPDIPKNVIIETSNENSIIPLTTTLVDGEVNFIGPRNIVNYSDESNILFDIIARQVNRFAIHHEQGSDFVLGWVYNINNYTDISIHVREDILNIYSNDKYPQDPSKINDRYNAYDDF
jgi:hypothetical protein